MIRNGLYHITVEFLDGVSGGNQGVMVLRDGQMRGGDSFFFAYGSYTAADGKWKGEVTNEEHSPTYGARRCGNARWSPSDLPAPIPIRPPKVTAWRSPASRASVSGRSCGYWLRTKPAR
ncbi:GrlR family regulatory protein [Bradyrhizobium sp. BR2003]|uniref:GrlR family regulatory protein n=1 Tax=Bradyrhizobium sp. BR2003 TaxID=1419258 RepID=UPI001FEFD0FF|nr:GrlR family regulatory protein [Bradyrhizobium sp. BR2003]